MRIIAGTHRGKKLIEKSDATTRPTTDRVRENIFNVLSNLIDLRGAKVLDLFAGCGGLGLECYSRGAAEIVFNDADKSACEIIKKNCKATGLDVILSGAQRAQSKNLGSAVHNLDFPLALEKLKSKKFDLIFLDPPYESDFIETALQIIAKQKMLSENGIIVIETDKEMTPLSGKGWQSQADGVGVKVKTYGRARLYFLNQDSLSSR